MKRDYLVDVPMHNLSAMCEYCVSYPIPMWSALETVRLQHDHIVKFTYLPYRKC